MQENIAVIYTELFQQWCPHFFKIPDQKAQIKTIKNELIKIDDEIKAIKTPKEVHPNMPLDEHDEYIKLLALYQKLEEIHHEKFEQSVALRQTSKAIARRVKACTINDLKTSAIGCFKRSKRDLKEYNNQIEAKITEQLKIQDKTTLGERRLVLTSVAKFFNNPLLIIDNPKKIILQKQPDSENILVCWYEDGKIKRESLKAEKLSDDLLARFPIQTGIENAIEISEKNWVQAVTSTLTSYSSTWFDVIPVEIRNFFKKILLLVESFSSVPNTDETPEFENKSEFINRNHISRDEIKILAFYREKYDKNEQKLSQLSEELTKKKKTWELKSEKTFELLAVVNDVTAKNEHEIKKLQENIKTLQEDIKFFENKYSNLVVEQETAEKNTVYIEENSPQFWFYINSKHFKKDLYQLTKEMIERFAVPALPDELVYKAYPHLSNRV